MTRHVELIHLSDIHFGKSHRFRPALTPDGATPAPGGYRTLVESLVKDLRDPLNEPPRPFLGEPGQGYGRDWDIPPMPKLLCLSGDFTMQGTKAEFAQAAELVNQLRVELQLSHAQVFACPGNHDLDWEAKEVGLRWGEYAAFLNKIYPEKFDAENAAHFGGVSQCEDTGVLVLSLNSEMAVHHQEKDETRGDLSPDQLLWAKGQLDAIPEKKRRTYIKIAMVHHHPILLPTLSEPGRGYDAISNAQHLLTLLHKYGFHVVLHGHKHYPHTFHESVRNAFERTDEHALVVVAGGSCGSSELPDKAGATQTYNRIRIHWNPGQGSSRVQVVTRGLVRHDNDGADLLPPEWYWRRLATDDRASLLGRKTRIVSPSAMRYSAPEPKGDPSHARRDHEYERTRGNFAAAEVRPSLLPGQTNEVQLRIVQHQHPQFPSEPKNEPVRVTWSAGYKFPKVCITRDEDPEFCAVFAYYGGALMRAELQFADQYVCDLFIYAPMLPSEPASPGPGGTASS
jgi:3',5'-cyclic AMP phosphodiesterase CpdA